MTLVCQYYHNGKILKITWRQSHKKHILMELKNIITLVLSHMFSKQESELSFVIKRSLFLAQTVSMSSPAIIASHHSKFIFKYCPTLVLGSRVEWHCKMYQGNQDNVPQNKLSGALPGLRRTLRDFFEIYIMMFTSLIIMFVFQVK